MDLEFSYGLMVLNIKVNGIKIKLMVKGNFSILMVTHIKEIGFEIRQMGLEFIFI